MTDWLDGPMFLAWLEAEHGFRASQHSSNAKRRAQAWKHGEKVSIWKADELLTSLELHISLIPENVWVESQSPTVTQALRDEVVARRSAGASPQALSRETGISERTIRKWTQKSKAKAAR